jgi:hypothetical protein
MTGSRGPFSSFVEATWEHSQFSAACAELHAVKIERADAFSARLLVLLHVLASNTVFRIAREHCLGEASCVRPAAMAKLLDDWVPPTALRIAENWKLPTELCNVLAAPEAPGLARSLLRATSGRAAHPGESRAHARALSARSFADDQRRAKWTVVVGLASMHLTVKR